MSRRRQGFELRLTPSSHVERFRPNRFGFRNSRLATVVLGRPGAQNVTESINERQHFRFVRTDSRVREFLTENALFPGVFFLVYQSKGARSIVYHHKIRKAFLHVLSMAIYI